MCGYTRQGRIRNGIVEKKVGVAPTVAKIIVLGGLGICGEDPQKH